VLAALLIAFGLRGERVSAGQAAEPASESAAKPAPDKAGWKTLFDGKTLSGWKSTQFGGEGKVYVKDGAIVIERGNDMTGITYTGEAPKLNYELALETKRVDGSDFFATTTFPVADSHCSLVVGGWGGSVVGLSSIDGYDASDNQTNKIKDFKSDQWYRIRIRVSRSKIEAWIDQEKMVDVVCTWNTGGAVRNMRVRSLTAAEIKAAREDAEKQADQ
jgi:hypothetical protein